MTQINITEVLARLRERASMCQIESPQDQEDILALCDAYAAMFTGMEGQIKNLTLNAEQLLDTKYQVMAECEALRKSLADADMQIEDMKKQLAPRQKQVPRDVSDRVYGVMTDGDSLADVREKIRKPGLGMPPIKREGEPEPDIDPEKRDEY